ncbi:hypothetical protein [Streptomyces spectabilis]|uniref:Head-tail adaptor protein n=1 Tax=Streptomyces spectabilis TaxID=68270 RepID=A0A5P2XA23_STRST|nr:hypothetical protein [Streptomyces spectabilis]MBB5103324.1 hypothetical protein [Streptomyces spectabilis]MCI3902515.1 hypothetical protein [Streptomyces spectabilis]QEV59850.1 hypothetical protein CP982_14800 [Streptomyces spectabilis]GGV54195.1 hypothetical protein GCM10010245_85600 [Streptomyces spectabilis]
MTLHYTQTVVLLRAPFITDRYGNTTSDRDWDRSTRTTVRRVSVQPDTSAEDTGDRPVVVTGWRLVTRTGVDLDLAPGDRVVALGRVLDVDGDVARWTLGGRHHHTEARLKEVSG